jgi:hypothetical protein
MLSFPMGYCGECGPEVQAKAKTIAAIRRKFKGTKILQCRQCKRTIGIYQAALRDHMCGECQPIGEENATR